MEIGKNWVKGRRLVGAFSAVYIFSLSLTVLEIVGGGGPIGPPPGGGGWEKSPGGAGLSGSLTGRIRHVHDYSWNKLPSMR